MLHNEAGDGYVRMGSNPIASEDEPYYAELAHFVACIEGKVTPRVTAQDGLMAVKVGLAAIRSLETGQPVTIADFQE
jgi:UDP-N-acetylglucosamine 3-dehydrogenase